MPGANLAKKRTWGTLTSVRVPPHLRIEIGKYALRLEEDFGIDLGTSSEWLGISKRTLVEWSELWRQHPELEDLVVLPALGLNQAIAGSKYMKVTPRLHGRQPCSPPDSELKQRLAEHQEWLASGGKAGKCLELGDNPQTDFSDCHLSYIKNSKAFLLFSKFDGARLDGAELCGADCSLASFYGADLRGADLSKTTLYGVDFRKADLREANLDGAWAIGANFGGANIEGASLRDTVLSHYGLRDQMKIYLATLGIYGLVWFGRRVTTIITQSQLESAKTGPGTVFPPGMETHKSRSGSIIESYVILDYPLKLIDSEVPHR